MFAALFAKAVDEKGPGFVIESFNQGRIRMAKETLTFKLIKFMPASFINDAAERMAGNVEEEAKK